VVVNTKGAEFFACRFQVENSLKPAKNKALQSANIHDEKTVSICFSWLQALLGYDPEWQTSFEKF